MIYINDVYKSLMLSMQIGYTSPAESGITKDLGLSSSQVSLAYFTS